MTVAVEDAILVMIRGEPRRARVVILDVVHEDDGREVFGYTLGEVYSAIREMSPDGFATENNEGRTWARGWAVETEAELRAGYNLSTERDAEPELSPAEESDNFEKWLVNP